MSREQSGPAATPKAGKSKETPAERKHRQLKLFKPEYRTPFKYTELLKGRKPKAMPGWTPDAWLIAAIQSGLVEMGSLEKAGRVGELLEPIGDAPAPIYDGPPLEELWLQGTQDALNKLRGK